MRVIKVKEVVEEEEGGKDNWKNNKDKHTQMTNKMAWFQVAYNFLNPYIF